MTVTASRDKGWWVLLTLVPFGWGNWLAFLFAGVRAHERRWKLRSVGYAFLALMPFLVLDPLLPDNDDSDAVIGIVLLATWMLGIVATARRIIAVREQVDGFTSLEDLGMTMDLDGETVEDLRGRVVFLPR